MTQQADAMRASHGQAPTQEAPSAVAGPSEMHEAMCPALTGGRCTCERNDPAVDKALARFCGGIGDGSDAPYPGMISAFERYYSQSFTDKDWRNEASVWAAAWKQAMLTAAAPTTQPAPTPSPSPASQGDALDVTHKGRCEHCIYRHDGVYGSWAAPCPYHDDDGNPRVDAARAAQEGNINV